MKETLGVFAEKQKVCFVCNYTDRIYDVSGRKRERGFHVFVEDLSEFVDGCMEVLKPKFTIQTEHYMSFSAIDSTLYFTNANFHEYGTLPSPPVVYSVDVQTLTLTPGPKVLGAADFCPLPCMSGKKRLPLIASIPGSKKLLVFSSLFFARPRSFPFPPHGYSHFEMFDVETNSWEKLPQFLIRKAYRVGYILHLCDAEEGAMEFPLKSRAFEKGDYMYEIYAYAVSFTDEGRRPVFLVQLTCAVVTLALDLDSATKRWRLYDGDRDGVVHSWAYPNGGKGDPAFRVPKTFSAEDDKVKRVYHVMTAMDGEKRVGILRTGTGGRSKQGLITLDVVNLMAEKDVLASYNFVVKNNFKYFFPMLAFLYHPKLN